jgi:hypothetical protein
VKTGWQKVVSRCHLKLCISGSRVSMTTCRRRGGEEGEGNGRRASGGCGCSLRERRGGLGLGAWGAMAGVLVAGARGTEVAWAWLGRALMGCALTGSCCPAVPHGQLVTGPGRAAQRSGTTAQA